MDIVVTFMVTNEMYDGLSRAAEADCSNMSVIARRAIAIELERLAS